MRLSYSALSTFRQCPKKYHWQYVERLRVPPTPDQFFGILIHDILDMALRKAPIIEQLDKLLAFYKEKWNPKIFKAEQGVVPYRSEGSGARSDIKAQETYEEGLKIIKNFHADYKPGMRDILHTEKFFEIIFEKHLIVGKIDRIDKLPSGELEVVDYKTNKKLPDPESLKNDLQLSMYHWGASSLWKDVPKIKLTLHFLRHNQKISNIEISTHDELKKFILETVEKIKVTDHKATPSKLCHWCEYLHLCANGQEFLKTQNEKRKVQNDNSKVKTEKQNNNFQQASLF